MGIELNVVCDDCQHKITLDDVVYCYECVETLKKEIEELRLKATERPKDYKEEL